MNHQDLIVHILHDSESLLAYERGDNPSVEDVQRRIIAMERLYNRNRSDAYYEGKGLIWAREKKSLSDFLISTPMDIANAFFVRDGSRCWVHEDKFPEWMSMLCFIPPSWIIAADMISRFDSSIICDSSALCKFVSGNLFQYKHTSQLHPDIKFLNYLVSQGDGLNDLHIHLNGTTETDVIWIYTLQHKDEMSALYRDRYEKEKSVRKLAEQIMPGFEPSAFASRIETASDLRVKMLSKLMCFYTQKKIRIQTVSELAGIFSSMPLMDSMIIDEIVFQTAVMSYIITTKDEEVVHYLHHYLLIKGLLHRFLVMQTTQSSFPQFQMLTDNPFRELVEKQYDSRFGQLAGSAGIPYIGLIEGRFSPKKTSKDNLQIISKAATGFEKAVQSTSALSKARLKLIAHFIKQPENASSRNLVIRHCDLRRELAEKAHALAHLLENNSFANGIVAGIDAAASELDASPEVFAPTFRYMRFKGIKHFTFHVGEDFRHLLTGIRSVYEAVDFLDLRAGDRVGHGTAIGIDPSLWLQRSGPTCILSQGEWLDDLVFVWNLARNGDVPVLTSKMPMIESAIAEYSHKIYGYSYPPYLLLEAWKLRYYDPCCYLLADPLKEDDGYIANHEKAEIVKKLSEADILRILESYHAPASINGQSTRDKFDELMEISVNLLFTADDIVSIQNTVLSYLVKKEIVIEALPSSNLRISYYKDLEEYHLKRWISDANGMTPSVVLGTDDPGIFMTNIYNEYSLAYAHVKKSGISAKSTIEMLMKNSEIYKFK